MEAEATKLKRSAGPGTQVPSSAQVEVKQLVRTIGILDTPESQSVKRVNARLAELLNEGWTIHTAQALGAAAGGAVTVYYLLIK